MTNKTFTVVGITDYKDTMKVRFTNDMALRIKRLDKYGASRLDFIELPHAMTKIEALKYMLTRKEFQSPDDQATIQDTLDDKEADQLRHLMRQSGEVRRRGRKPKNKSTTLADVLAAINS